MTSNKGGRPPAGLRGERVSTEYARLGLRVPREMADLLDVASGALRQPQWRVLCDALAVYVGDGKPLSTEEQKAIRQLARLHQRPR